MKKAFIATLALTLLAAIAITAMAAPISINRAGSDFVSQAQTPNPISTTENGISWNVNAPDGSILVVSGPNGYYYSTQFAAKSTPALNTVGLADGVYTYELTLVNNIAVDGNRRDNTSAPVATISGSFSMVEGAPLYELNLGSDIDGTNITPTGPTPNDQVIVDDLIVNGGSACVGQDCVNGESFGFDTFRIKENNLRIHFDDTSNSASFPSNDWRIVANDSSNGGANYLAFEDSTAGRQIFRVDAGAPANSLYVDSGGDGGLGTNAPVVELHVADGDTPTVRLEQNGASGFTPQTWDIAGNETNFFVRDTTNGSSLPFRIKPGSGNDDAIVIKGDGNVGLGTDNPSQDLHIRSTDGDGQLLIQETNASEANRTLLTLENTGAPRMSFTNSTDNVTWELFMDGNNDFNLNETGVANVEFLLRQNGSLRVGPGGVANLSLDTSGNLVIAGSLTQAPIPPFGTESLSLEASSTKDVTVFAGTREFITYRADNSEEIQTVRHLAVNADEFNAAYNVGTDGTIAPMDVAVAAFASAQSLTQEVEQLKAENAELEARISELEALVNTLIEAEGK